MRSAIIFICIFGFISCTVTNKYYKPGDVLILQPGPDEGIDAYIEYWPGANYPNRNWGDYEAFAAVAWTAGDALIVRCLLKFDLSNIPHQTKIKKATLSLYAVSTPGIGSGHSVLSGPNDFALMKTTSPWEEYGVTWNTQPSVSNKNKVILPASDSETQDYTGIDVTAMVQDMIRKPAKNFGFMIRLLDENYYRRVIFGSSDNINIEKRPGLTIEF